jgi:hypothetical protein
MQIIQPKHFVRGLVKNGMDVIEYERLSNF